MTGIRIGILVVGIYLAVIGICAVVIWLEKKFPGREYDERQYEVRGKAYRLAFISGLLYYIPVIIWQMLQAETGEVFSDLYFILFLGIWIQLLLFSTYCIWNGAALPLSEKHAWAIGTCVLFSGYYFLKYFVYGVNLNRICLKLMPLLMGVGFAYLAILYLIQFWRERKG